ncbi:hypothetical protein [Nannocystis exedens]|uniref:hypothetical protein n=1 Tax=Nannocystis exedens TaxID=54 RepID=UPI001160A6A3|nr:hypothetical protein [Nannocystis exedens]
MLPSEARASESTQPPAPAQKGSVVPLMGFNLCFGAVEEGTTCHVRLPDLRTPPPQPKPTWFTLLGKTVCLPDTSATTACDVRLPRLPLTATPTPATRGS